jgi:elongation factor 2
MKFSVDPVVQIAVEPKDPADLEHLINGFRLLTQSDGCVQWITSPSNENIVCASA